MRHWRDNALASCLDVVPRQPRSAIKIMATIRTAVEAPFCNAPSCRVNHPSITIGVRSTKSARVSKANMIAVQTLIIISAAAPARRARIGSRVPKAIMLNAIPPTTQGVAISRVDIRITSGGRVAASLATGLMVASQPSRLFWLCLLPMTRSSGFDHYGKPPPIPDVVAPDRAQSGAMAAGEGPRAR